MTERITTNEEYLQFLDRFYQFYDSVFRSISLHFLSDGTQTIDLVVSARDSLLEDDEGWVCIVIAIEKVKETLISKKPKTSIQVLSQGIHLATYENLVGMEFGGAIDPPSSLDVLRQSEAYILGENISFEVFPYETEK